MLVVGCKDINISSYSSNNPFYGVLIIPSIKMEKGFYNLGNKNNVVNKNITLIDSKIKNTYILAAHSGTGRLAYFNDLRYLSIEDDIYIKFKSNTNHYIISEIKREVKLGSIHIPNKENMLVLTTCDQEQKGYQLIIIAYLHKEK